MDVRCHVNHISSTGTWTPLHSAAFHGRHDVAAVFQEPVLFDTSIWENLTMGLRNGGDEGAMVTPGGVGKIFVLEIVQIADVKVCAELAKK